MAALVERTGRLLPHGWGDLARQIALFALANLCYETVRGIADGRRALAFANAERIIDVERALGTFFEPGLQQAALESRWIIDIANWLYMNTHFVITTTFLVGLYLFRNQAFYFVRNMFMIAMGLALVGYALMPTAPPRMLEEYGFVDTISTFVGINENSALLSLFVNPYAAMPSMHIAFALMIGIPGALLTQNRFLRVVWLAYPVLVFAVIVLTGNHFWLDAAAGALVAGIAALGAQRLLAPMRPAAWSWRSAREAPA